MTRFPLAAALLLFTLPAAADVAPGPGPQQQQCSLQAVQQPGQQCAECSAWYEQADKCQRDFGSQGYTQACRAPGASVWKEVWCRGPASGPPPEKKGCGACAVGADTDDGLWGLAIAGLVGLALSRRRSR